MEQPRVQREQGVRENTSFYHVGDGFYYRFNRFEPSVVYFLCVHRACSGRAVFREGLGFRHTQAHNHPRNPRRHHILNHRRVIVNRARTIEYVSFVDIIESERRRIADRFIRQELTIRRLRCAMQRARSEMFPNMPESLRHLTFILQDPAWSVLTQTNDLLDNIYSGSVDALDGSHHIIFLSQRCLQVLREVRIIFADGTFKISPSISGCYQVFCIVTIDSHTVLPLVWVLMESKTLEAYLAVLIHLRERLIQWNFVKVVSDFEDAIITAFELVFAVEVQGCFFHSVQAMGSWARSNIPLWILQNCPALVNVVRCCCLLPLLPQHLLQRGMNAIRVSSVALGPFQFLAQPFMDYVEVDWLQHVNRGRVLSVAGCPHRTNNASESNNHRMNRKVKVHNPNVYLLIRTMVDMEDSTTDDILSLASGIIPSRHRAVSSISNDARIQELTLQLPADPTDLELLLFLLDAAYSVENVLQNALGLQRQ